MERRVLLDDLRTVAAQLGDVARELERVEREVGALARPEEEQGDRGCGGEGEGDDHVRASDRRDLRLMTAGLRLRLQNRLRDSFVGRGVERLVIHLLVALFSRAASEGGEQ